MQAFIHKFFGENKISGIINPPLLFSLAEITGKNFTVSLPITYTMI